MVVITDSNRGMVIDGLQEVKRVNLNLEDTIGLIEDNYDYYQVWLEFFSDYIFEKISIKVGMSFIDTKLFIIDLFSKLKVEYLKEAVEKLIEMNENISVRLMATVKYKDEEIKDTIFDIKSFFEAGENFHDAMVEDSEGEDDSIMESSDYFKRITNMINSEAICMDADHNFYLDYCEKIEEEDKEKNMESCVSVIYYCTKDLDEKLNVFIKFIENLALNCDLVFGSTKHE